MVCSCRYRTASILRSSKKRLGPTAPSEWLFAWGPPDRLPGTCRRPPGDMYVGHLHGQTTPQLEKLNALLDAVIPREISDNISGVLWSKLTYTCLGYFGSLADASLATSCVSDLDRQMLVAFFAEVVAVGAAVGARFIPLAEYNPPDFHPSNFFDKRLAAVNQLAKGWKPDDRKGPLRQILRGIKTEVDYTLGHVVREGDRMKIPTPLCREL